MNIKQNRSIGCDVMQRMASHIAAAPDSGFANYTREIVQGADPKSPLGQSLIRGGLALRSSDEPSLKPNF